MTTQTLSNRVHLSRFNARALTRYLPAIGRVLLGAIFFVFGLNYFLNFIPPPSGPMPAGAVAFGGALMQTGYMMPLIKGTEVVCGALLLSNRFVALALVVLAPVIVNIVAFHARLAPDAIGMALFVLALELYLAWTERAAYAPLLSARSNPPHAT